MQTEEKHASDARRAQLSRRIASAQIRLGERLRALDLGSLNISEYNRRYLRSHVSDLGGALGRYGRLLYLCVDGGQVPLEDFVVVDYGGGSGLFSFLAVETGIGNVVYNDIYDVSCADVERLSEALELAPSHIVCADTAGLVSYLTRNSVFLNAIASYDVLEHIYDVESHFRELRRLPRGFRVVYASTANMANPRCARAIRRKQLDAEFNNRKREWGHKERDSLQSFLGARENIISSYAPDLSAEAVERLARSTRGLIQQDIEMCVDEFRARGGIAYHIDHPTNTCDPYTGNWCEHLIDLEWLTQVLTREGFSVDIAPGRYDSSGSLPKRCAKAVLNAAIGLFGPRVMFIAPYYVVRATC